MLVTTVANRFGVLEHACVVRSRMQATGHLNECVVGSRTQATGHLNELALTVENSPE